MMIECRLAEDSVKTSPYGLSEAKRQMPIYHGNLFKFLILESFISWSKERLRKKEYRQKNKKIKLFKRTIKRELLKAIIKGQDYIEYTIYKLYDAFGLSKTDINQVLDEVIGAERWDCFKKDERQIITGYIKEILHYQIYVLPRPTAMLYKFYNGEEEVYG